MGKKSPRGDRYQQQQQAAAANKKKQIYYCEEDNIVASNNINSNSLERDNNEIKQLTTPTSAATAATTSQGGRGGGNVNNNNNNSNNNSYNNQQQQQTLRPTGGSSSFDQIANSSLTRSPNNITPNNNNNNNSNNSNSSFSTAPPNNLNNTTVPNFQRPTTIRTGPALPGAGDDEEEDEEEEEEEYEPKEENEQYQQRKRKLQLQQQQRQQQKEEGGEGDSLTTRLRAGSQQAIAQQFLNAPVNNMSFPSSSSGGDNNNGNNNNNDSRRNSGNLNRMMLMQQQQQQQQSPLPSSLDPNFDTGLPELSDVVFTPEKVNAHTLMNKWITQDETRNFAFLRKEKKAVVTFQCRIIVKGAKHIQFQVGAGPNVEFLMPTWMLVRYIQAELLPPCIFENYSLVENWMKNFIAECKNLSDKAEHNFHVDPNASASEVHQAQIRMTRHTVHAAASVVNASDLFLGLIQAARENASSERQGKSLANLYIASGMNQHQNEMLHLFPGNNHNEGEGNNNNNSHSAAANAAAGGWGGAGENETPPETPSGGAQIYSSSSSSSLLQSNQQQGRSSTPVPAEQQQQQKQGFFSSWLNRAKSKQQQQQQQQQEDENFSSPSSVSPTTSGGFFSSSSSSSPPLLSSQQQSAQNAVKLSALIPSYYRTGPPQPLHWRSFSVWCLDFVYALATQTKVSDIRSKFLLPRPTTKEEYTTAEVMRDQVKKNRTNTATFFMFIFLMLCRYVSFDLFVILLLLVLYATRRLFTEYKQIFIYLTKRTARNRVNRVKDWFTFGVRGKSTADGSNASASAAASGGGASGQQAITAPDQDPGFDLDDWDFDM